MKKWRTTGLSIELDIFEQLNKKAHELGISRHKLIINAIKDSLTQKPSEAQVRD